MPQAQVSANGVMTTTQIPIWSAWFPSGVGILVTVPSTATVQYTVDISGDSSNVAPTNWNAHDVLVNLTSSANSNISYPLTYVRLRVTSYSGSGNIIMNVVYTQSHNIY